MMVMVFRSKTQQHLSHFPVGGNVCEVVLDCVLYCFTTRELMTSSVPRLQRLLHHTVSTA